MTNHNNMKTVLTGISLNKITEGARAMVQVKQGSYTIIMQGIHMYKPSCGHVHGIHSI